MFTKTIAGLALAGFIGVLGASAAQASTPPGLQNVGGRTPASKTITVAPGTITGLTGKAWARSARRVLKITITGGAGVTPAYCHEDSDEKYFCYYYEAFVTETGTLTTIPRALAPAGGARIKGAFTGTYKVSYVVFFYDQAYPYAKLMPGSVASYDPRTVLRGFFGPGAAYALKSLSAASSYRLGECGQVWAVTNGVSKGNITGC